MKTLMMKTVKIFTVLFLFVGLSACERITKIAEGVGQAMEGLFQTGDKSLDVEAIAGLPDEEIRKLIKFEPDLPGACARGYSPQVKYNIPDDPNGAYVVYRIVSELCPNSTTHEVFAEVQYKSSDYARSWRGGTDVEQLVGKLTRNYTGVTSDQVKVHGLETISQDSTEHECGSRSHTRVNNQYVSPPPGDCYYQEFVSFYSIKFMETENQALGTVRVGLRIFTGGDQEAVKEFTLYFPQNYLKIYTDSFNEQPAAQG